jgi:hypothetical protein
MKRLALILPLACLALAGCAGIDEQPHVKGSGRVHPDTPAPADAVDARKLLADLTVAPALAMTGYSREAFTHWTDADGDGCDARDEVLAAESQLDPAPDCHSVERGNWYSPYDDQTFTESADLDIDHLVALAEAWRSGAARWPAAARERYANDLDYPISLLAVSAATNRAKGDRDPAAWQPPNGSYRCVYLAHWVAVKWRWNLTIDRNELAVLEEDMDECRDESLRVADPAKVIGLATTGVGSVTGNAPEAHPHSDAPSPAAPVEPQAEAREPQPQTKTPGAAAPADKVPATCAEVQAAGLGPYRRGVDAEYANFRDGDGDGVVCE